MPPCPCGRPQEFPGSCLWLGQALAIVTIWVANQQVEDLSASPPLFVILSFKQIKTKPWREEKRKRGEKKKEKRKKIKKSCGFHCQVLSVWVVSGRKILQIGSLNTGFSTLHFGIWCWKIPYSDNCPLDCSLLSNIPALCPLDTPSIASSFFFFLHILRSPKMSPDVAKGTQFVKKQNNGHFRIFPAYWSKSFWSLSLLKLWRQVRLTDYKTQHPLQVAFCTWQALKTLVGQASDITMNTMKQQLGDFFNEHWYGSFAFAPTSPPAEEQRWKWRHNLWLYRY